MVNKDDDALGMAVKDYIATRDESIEIQVLSDEFDDDIIPVPYLFRSFDDMPLLEQEALRQCEGAVLDVGAGAGCHALYLQKQGLKVAALEISPYCVVEMKKQGIANVISSDFFEMDDAVSYDTILMLMNGIGIVGSLERLGEFFAKVKTMLKPGGKVLFDSSDVSYLYDNDEQIKELDHYYGEFNFAMKYGDVITDAFRWLYVDIETIREYAEQNGFAFTLLYEDDHYGYLGELKVKE